MTVPLQCTPLEYARLSARLWCDNQGRMMTAEREQAIVGSILRTRCVMETVREMHCGQNTVRQICKRRGIRV